MVTTVPYDRVYGALIGQAVGDALGAPTEGMTREEIASRYGWVDDFVSDDPVGTDDTEYAVLSARIVLKHGHELTPADVTAAWRENLVEQDGGFYGGGFSEMTAINNLKAGLVAPQTGTDNHEMWSDGTAMRIAPVGVICAGDPREAARLAAIDAQVSHARDGIYSRPGHCRRRGRGAGRVVLGGGSRGWPRRGSSRLVVGADDHQGRRDRPPGAGSAASNGPVVRGDLDLPLPVGRRRPGGHRPGHRRVRRLPRRLREAVLGGINVGALTPSQPWPEPWPAHCTAGNGSEGWRERINRVRGHCIKADAGTDLAELAGALHRALGTEHVNETDAVR